MTFQVIQGDCLAEMAKLPPNSVDACITDPPYGTTACSWDSVIPFAPMWAELKRIVKPKGAIVLFGSQPFTSALVMSNPAMFKYQWVWDKARGVGFQIASVRPMMRHEDVAVFCQESPHYNPQMTPRDVVKQSKCYTRSESSPLAYNDGVMREYFDRFPTSIIDMSNASQQDRFHPTQKPVDLLRYLVRTYTNAGDTVLDFTCGSGTTGVACEIEERDSINIDSDGHYCDVARARMTRTQGVACDIPKRVKEYAPTPLFEAVA